MVWDQELGFVQNRKLLLALVPLNDHLGNGHKEELTCVSRVSLRGLALGYSSGETVIGEVSISLQVFCWGAAPESAGPLCICRLWMTKTKKRNVFYITMNPARWRVPGPWFYEQPYCTDSKIFLFLFLWTNVLIVSRFG